MLQAMLGYFRRFITDLKRAHYKFHCKFTQHYFLLNMLYFLQQRQKMQCQRDEHFCLDLWLSSVTRLIISSLYLVSTIMHVE